jgi:type III secretory pathway component EscS
MFGIYSLLGLIVGIVTFPGVIVHEMAHQLFCRICKVPVFEVKYLRFGNPVGYVLHEPVRSPYKNLAISIGPFLVNTVVGALIALPAAIHVLEFEDYSDPLKLVVIWLGISILMHAFPSTGDAQALVASVLKNKEVRWYAKALVAPVVGLIYAGAIGSMFWLDLAYAVAVAAGLAKIVAALVA